MANRDESGKSAPAESRATMQMRERMDKTLQDFNRGDLKLGKYQVKDRQTAIAMAMHEARKRGNR